MDSLALKAMPVSMIHRSEEQGLDWTIMGLYPKEVERAEPRDTQANMDAIIAERSAEHAWDYLGKQGHASTRFCEMLTKMMNWRRSMPGKHILKIV